MQKFLLQNMFLMHIPSKPLLSGAVFASMFSWTVFDETASSAVPGFKEGPVNSAKNDDIMTLFKLTSEISTDTSLREDMSNYVL